MNQEQYKVLHAIYCLQGVGSKTLRLLCEHFLDPKKILIATLGDLISLGIPSSAAHKITSLTKETIELSWKNLLQNNIKITAYTDDLYPINLKEIPDYPPLIYYQGDLEILNQQPSIAIVGTRKPTSYGQQAAQKLTQELTHAGIIIVSGLAFGLDSIAHKTCLENHGLTVAVLGHGLAEKYISPRSHAPLAKAILNNGGVLISEYPPHIQASAGTFPARNRIIAGITSGTLVIEAAEKSGTLITARNALEYNRSVFSIPGSIFSHASEGANTLIKNGARAVTNISDILDELGWQNTNNIPLSSNDTSSLSKEEQIILKALDQEQLSTNALARETRFDLSKINTSLTILEMNGFIKEVGNGIFIKTKY